MTRKRAARLTLADHAQRLGPTGRTQRAQIDPGMAGRVVSANVRCAGGGQWYETWEDAEIGADRNVPCGWTGTRTFTDPEASDAEYIARLTRKPCPKCGGEVNLIVEDQGSGGVW